MRQPLYRCTVTTLRGSFRWCCEVSCSRAHNSCIIQQIGHQTKECKCLISGMVVQGTMSGSRRLKIYPVTHLHISIRNSICSASIELAHWPVSIQFHEFTHFQMYFTEQVSFKVNTNLDIQFHICSEQEFPDIRCKHTFIQITRTHMLAKHSLKYFSLAHKHTNS